MLEVLIADDERIQREGLLDYVDWNEYGMEVVACASNGYEALELIKLHKVDVLITDIKMPKMDGLELSKRVREIIPDIKILIISGNSFFQCKIS